MALKHKFATSSTTVISLAASLADTANTYSGQSGCTMTALNNATDKYPHVRFVLEVPETFAAAPSSGAVFEVWMTQQDIDSTADETPVPGSGNVQPASRLGLIRIDTQDVAQRKPLIVMGALAGVESALFYIRNRCGQATTYSSTPLTLKATPFTFEDV